MSEPVAEFVFCKKCNAAMVHGVALAQTIHISKDDLGGDAGTVSIGGPGELVNCYKCPVCGHSILR